MLLVALHSLDSCLRGKSTPLKAFRYTFSDSVLERKREVVIVKDKGASHLAYLGTHFTFNLRVKISKACKTIHPEARSLLTNSTGSPSSSRMLHRTTLWILRGLCV